MKWQPIATAPKDGTRILAWGEPDGVELLRWHAAKPRGWTEAWRAHAVPQQPTHWMPLPKPPKEAHHV